MRKIGKLTMENTKRGDTIIEVMFAIAIFCMVAIISVTMMNLGTNNAQAALEQSIVRNEINAQAEALRFIHSAYIAEKTLPEKPEEKEGDWNYNDVNIRYQQYKALWEEITGNALGPNEAKTSGLLNLSELLNNSAENSKFPAGVRGCDRVYENLEGSNINLLQQSHAFVLNTRNLNKLGKDPDGKLIGTDAKYTYISANDPDKKDIFQAAPLNARIIYQKEGSTNGEADNSSSGKLSESDTRDYDQVYRAEGIWVIAVKGTEDAGGETTAKYYDFYIESCWYGPNTTSPSTLDTVIRLYNPENV